MNLDNFVPACADNVSKCARDFQLLLAELTNDHGWLVALLSLCQGVAIEREDSGDFLLVQSVLLGLNAQLELDDGGLEGGLGGEAELVAFLGEENGWRHLIADLSEEEADACNALKMKVILLLFSLKRIRYDDELNDSMKFHNQLNFPLLLHLISSFFPHFVLCANTQRENLIQFSFKFLLIPV